MPAMFTTDTLTENEIGAFGHLHTVKEPYSPSVKRLYADISIYADLL